MADGANHCFGPARVAVESLEGQATVNGRRHRRGDDGGQRQHADTTRRQDRRHGPDGYSRSGLTSARSLPKGRLSGNSMMELGKDRPRGDRREWILEILYSVCGSDADRLRLCECLSWYNLHIAMHHASTWCAVALQLPAPDAHACALVVASEQPADFLPDSHVVLSGCAVAYAFLADVFVT